MNTQARPDSARGASMATLDRGALEAKVNTAIRRVPLSQLVADPKTFQARDPEATPLPQKVARAMSDHVSNLVDAIKRNGGEIDPIVVMQNGLKEFVILDGHHRHKAYKRYAKSLHAPLKVPCRMFTGSKEDALLYARSCNLKNTLNMTAGERSQNAWVMVCRLQGEWESNRKLAQLVGVNEKTIRAQLKAFSGRFKGVPLEEIPRWREVTQMNWEAGEFDVEAHERKVEAETERILKSDIGEGVLQELKKSLTREAMVEALNALLGDYGLCVCSVNEFMDEDDDEDSDF